MQQLTLPGIECVPGKVRRHGLREFHTYPLVSPGKDAAGVWRWLPGVCPRPRRGRFPSWSSGGRAIASRPCCSIWTATRPTGWSTCSARRCPGRTGLCGGGRICTPMLRTPSPGPVAHRREQAKRTPQACLARVGEYLAAELKADAAYSAVLGHNPISQASHGRYTTDWLREEPYSLAELVAFVPTGFRRPMIQPQTVYGRNDALFRAGMKWSGAPRNWGKWAGLGLTLRVWNTPTAAGSRAAAGGQPAPARRQAAGILHAAACRALWSPGERARNGRPDEK